MILLDKFLETNKLNILKIEKSPDKYIIYTYYNTILNISKYVNKYRIIITYPADSVEWFIEIYVLDIYDTCILIQDCLDGYYNFLIENEGTDD